MTTFVLVPGGWLGAWCWDPVAAPLTAAGHRVVTLELGSLPEDGVRAHTAQVTELVERVADEGPVVLVGHSYGGAPARGAADARPDLVARLVLIDSPIPEDGESVAALLPPDLAVPLDGELLHRPADPGHPAGWGSVADVPQAFLDRWDATPHTLPTLALTEPVRLTGGYRKVPFTGLLCVRNGMTTAAVRGLYETGAPRFGWLADRDVRFVELDSGHYPMFSMPEELARVLVRVADGAGESLLP